jgi:hypothetical protein
MNQHKVVGLGGLLHPIASQVVDNNVICTVAVVLNATLVSGSASQARLKEQFAVVIHEPTTIQCVASPITLGSITNCRATVDGNAPTGTVYWSTSGIGNFSSSTCSLTQSGFCQVKYTPASGVSPVPLTARYGGDSRNKQSYGIFPLAVKPKATTLTASCEPSSLSAASSGLFTCTVFVKGYNPTGTITWTQSGKGSVNFKSFSCYLTAGKCSVTFSPKSKGQVLVTATYTGDPNNLVAHRVRLLIVRP